MTNLAIGLWCSLGLLVLIALRIPIAIAMILIAVFGIWQVQGEFAAWFQLAGAPINNTTYGLSVIPLFILMGNLASQAGLSRDLYILASQVVGRIRGGLALATILACAGFSTLSGSSMATAATIGKISIHEMSSRGYSPAVAAGTVAAGGTIGILIPPSVMLVVYGILTEQSVRKLFAAGMVPGLLLTLCFMITAWLWARLRPQAFQAPVAAGAAGTSGASASLAGAASDTSKANSPNASQAKPNASQAEPSAPQAEPKVALGGVLSLLVLVVIVLGGLYAGFFTATESAAVGAVGTLLIALFYAGMRWRALLDALIDTASTSAMIFLIVIASALYATFLTVTGLSQSLTAFVSGLDVAPVYVLLVILGIYVVLGCFMDSLGMILLTVPVFYPVILKLGVDPIHFGILVVMVVEMGLITPPLGMNIFVVRSVAPQIPLGRVFQGAMPYLLGFVVATLLVLYWPALATWLPSVMHGS